MFFHLSEGERGYPQMSKEVLLVHDDIEPCSTCCMTAVYVVCLEKWNYVAYRLAAFAYFCMLLEVFKELDIVSMAESGWACWDLETFSRHSCSVMQGHAVSIVPKDSSTVEVNAVNAWDVQILQSSLPLSKMSLAWNLQSSAVNGSVMICLS